MSTNVKVTITPPAPNIIQIDTTKIIPVILPGSQVVVSISNVGGSNSTSSNLDEGFVAGETIEPYKVVYISQSGLAFKAGYNVPDSRDLVRGISLTAASTGNPIKVRVFGSVTNPDWNWGTNGPLYLQLNGDIGVVPPSTPGSYIQKIAIIKSSMVILLEIDQTTIRI